MQDWKKKSVVLYLGSPDSVLVMPGRMSFMGSILCPVLSSWDGSHLKFHFWICDRYTFINISDRPSVWYVKCDANLLKLQKKCD